jgi:alkylmercury lyase
MSDARKRAWAQQLQDRLLELGRDNLQLLPQVVRLLAGGRPLTAAQVDPLIANLGIAPDAAHQFLHQMTERNAQDQIVGAMGLSLGDRPHRIDVAGVRLSAWCALDTLFLSAILQQTATTESPSPASGRSIRLRVSPTQVEDVSPAGAVVSLVTTDLRREELASTEASWSAFCTHTHFFATHDEGERWVGGRDDIVIVGVDEGFALGQQMWPMLLAPTEQMAKQPARRRRTHSDLQPTVRRE